MRTYSMSVSSDKEDHMGKTMIKEELFPEIVDRYNTDGKSAAYDYLRSRYGIKNPYFVITSTSNNY